MSQVPAFETLGYEEHDGVATVTLDRPDVHNAFNSLMASELHTLWRTLRRYDDVRCIVLTGAGERAFSTGLDRTEQIGGRDSAAADLEAVGFERSPFMFNDLGDKIAPKSCDLWKPVVTAVNGMACGGAFYLLGESEFLIAAEHATFFDPHVTYGMCAAFEPMHMAGITPFPEIMRISLMGSFERMSAQRAFQIGMVSEVVPGDQLLARAQEVAAVIASQPASAVEGTVRALWSTRSMPQREAVRHGYAYTVMGTNFESMAEGQQRFSSGQRVEWKLR